MKLQHLLLHYKFHANDLLQKMSINRIQGVQDHYFWIHLSILNHAHCSLKSSQYHWYGNIRIIDVWTFLVEPIEITIFILDTLYFTLRRVKWLCAKRWLVNRHFSLLLLVPSQYRKRRWKLCITREKVKCSI